MKNPQALEAVIFAGARFTPDLSAPAPRAGAPAAGLLLQIPPAFSPAPLLDSLDLGDVEEAIPLRRPKRLEIEDE